MSNQDKPPFVVIDTEILLCWEADSLKHWENYEASKSSKYASNIAPDKWSMNTNQDPMGPTCFNSPIVNDLKIDPIS